MRLIGIMIALLSLSPALAQSEQFLVVTGIAQDAGYPQAACHKDCCKRVENGKAKAQMVSSLTLVDYSDSSYHIFEMTPDFRAQSRFVESKYQVKGPKSVFLSHAHIGHYSGLMFLGKESRSTNEVPCYVMPRMEDFLRSNGPWSQLVEIGTIELRSFENNTAEVGKVTVEAVQVPHRDEFSETIGFFIQSANKKVLFIPDIDKWDRWEMDLKTWISKADLLLLDGTFYSDGELKGRDMSQIPHPFVTETMDYLQDLSDAEKSKVHFIHLNHSNPLLWDKKSQESLNKRSFNLAFEGQVIEL